MNFSSLASKLHPILKANVTREYPNKQGHVLQTASDLQSPKERTPLFYGSFDWHSAVHSYAALVRLCRLQPESTESKETLTFLDTKFQATTIQAEYEHLTLPGNSGFEMPYGLAWLLTLCRELRLSQTDQTKRWLEYFSELEKLAAARMEQWLHRLSFPIRNGEHTQSAFSMILAWNWTLSAKHTALQSAIRDQSKNWYGEDADAPLTFEPSSYDFLSPALTEAALMARVYNRERYSEWLDAFLPSLSGTLNLHPVTPSDREDGKMVHLDGLNLSRSWMLQIISHHLDDTDPRKSVIESVGARHQSAAQGCLDAGTYAGTHWLGTFMLYNLTVTD